MKWITLLLLIGCSGDYYVYPKDVKTAELSCQSMNGLYRIRGNSISCANHVGTLLCKTEYVAECINHTRLYFKGEIR